MIIDNRVCTNLDFNVLERDDDTDVFIDIKGQVLDCYVEKTTRVQFVGARAVLIRLGEETENITVHVLQNTDIYSSMANFEIDLIAQRLYVSQEDNKVIIERKI